MNRTFLPWILLASAVLAPAVGSAQPPGGSNQTVSCARGGLQRAVNLYIEAQTKGDVSGLSAAATGIALNNTALIVAGMIVGASGSILTNLMAVAMNRSIPAIIAGGFGGGGAVAGAEGAGEHANYAGFGVQFGIGVGTLLLTLNVVLLSSYTLGCHAMRHLVGGFHDEVSKHSACDMAYACSSALNYKHQLFAWLSLFTVGLADLYVRLCSMGIWTDFRIL